MSLIGRAKAFVYELGSLFLLLWVIMFAVFFADTLCGPVIPYMLKEFLIEEAAVVAMLGYLQSVFNLVNTIIKIPGSILADKIARVSMVLFSLCIFPINFLLILFAANSLWILSSYLFLGIFIGFFMPAINALVADLTRKETRATAFAIFNLSWITSQIAGPIIGGYLADNLFLRFPPFLALIISITCPLILLIRLRSLKISRNKEKSEASLEKPKKENEAPFGITIALLCAAEFFSGLGNGILMPITTAFLMYALGTSPTEMGLAFSIGWGLATALAQIPGGRLTDKFGAKKVVVGCLLGATPLVLIQPLSTNVLQFSLILGIICFIGNLSTPAFSAWIANLIGSERRGKGYGLTSAAWSTGAIIGPIIGSLTWTMFKPNHFPPFAISAVPFLIELIFILLIRNSSKTNEIFVKRRVCDA